MPGSSLAIVNNSINFNKINRALITNSPSNSSGTCASVIITTGTDCIISRRIALVKCETKANQWGVPNAELRTHHG